MMSKKVYVQFADMLNREFSENKFMHNDASAREDVNIINRIADLFADDNPQFNREKFLKACGLGE